MNASAKKVAMSFAVTVVAVLTAKYIAKNVPQVRQFVL